MGTSHASSMYRSLSAGLGVLGSQLINRSIIYLLAEIVKLLIRAFQIIIVPGGLETSIKP
eukprot:scaffold619849_cov28-Prasinocladus_malaysianus.AAC.1